MADEDNIGQLDNNLNNSSGNNISSQLNVILKELSNLKQEVHGTNVSVASEVKKLKSEKDLVWRFAGNKIQYDFNSDCSDVVKQAIWAIENVKFDYCKEQLDDLAEKLRKSNKSNVLPIRPVGAGRLSDSMNRIRSPAIVKMKTKFIRRRGERLNVRGLLLGVEAAVGS